MASRTWIAVILACLVWFIYLKWFAPVPVDKKDVSTIKVEEERPVVEKRVDSVWDINIRPSKEVNFKTQLLEISFGSSGGKLLYSGCLKYRETISVNSAYVSLVNVEKTPLSLSTIFSDPKLKVFSDIDYESVTEKNKVIFKATHKDITVQKTYFINAEQYIIEYGMDIDVPKSNVSDYGELIIPLGGTKFEFDYSVSLKAWEVVAFQNDSVKRKQYDKIPKYELTQGETKWIAFGNKYFVSAIVNKSKINPDVIYVNEDKFKGIALRYPLKLKESKHTFHFEFVIYTGPKDLAHLAHLDGFKKLIDYGMWAFLAYPLLAIMKFFYTITKNWGLAIILLTIFVRILLYPLSLKQYNSMKAMQKLQPQLKSLKEKYKDDLKKFNQEQMNLFKTHKINPMGGCLPLLVQLPVFIALYSVLANSIELFHSPFFGWIKDLSIKDQYYILPILMGIVMFVQQKMTPTAGMDPTQEKIMLFMPIIFTIIMINLPSGLTLYIFVSTLLGIIQQWIINKSLKNAEVPVK